MRGWPLGWIPPLSRAVCVLGLVLCGFITAAMATKPVVAPARDSLFGEWESVRHSLRSDVRMQQFRPDDPRALWDRIKISPNEVESLPEVYACPLGPKLRNAGLSPRVLFHDERVTRPRWMQPLLSGKFDAYWNVDPYRRLPLSLYQLECKENPSLVDGTNWRARGTNWLALV